MFWILFLWARVFGCDFDVVWIGVLWIFMFFVGVLYCFFKIIFGVYLGFYGVSYFLSIFLENLYYTIYFWLEMVLGKLFLWRFF